MAKERKNNGPADVTRDSFVYRLTALIGKWFLVSLLTWLCSIPVFTAGTAYCAALAVTRQDYPDLRMIFGSYFSHFSACFKKTAGVFLPVIALILLQVLNLSFYSRFLEPGTAVYYAVMGIGFNVYEPDGGFPADIAEKAGPVFLERTRDAKNRLTGLFLNHFFDGYHGILSKAYAEDYKKRSIVIGKEIRVLTGTDYDAGPDAGKRAKALDIDDDCRLFVRYEDGTEEWLASGEISIRPV